MTSVQCTTIAPFVKNGTVFAVNLGAGVEVTIVKAELDRCRETCYRIQNCAGVPHNWAFTKADLEKFLSPADVARVVRECV